MEDRFPLVDKGAEERAFGRLHALFVDGVLELGFELREDLWGELNSV